ncbi:putative baseplate assembly protein [Actinorhabdospora filicis]|uniref:Baseplate assembly protein n=1 Tax=Actinorhabdospora filicis TaxID=1785913 RepID=A0A9W6WB77_9ACTN|nr:putative baseplate assembly protein [Actinorhabdospora filicis]GLZ80359.1 putative baseplate assembly protein [Actinorhabdospora filicis]
MSLPVPNLDDRRFQDLVDEAKRMVQQRCPEWTDHNVSDPGVTLIETFAMMVDQLLYRVNQVPSLHYLKFLDLIGVKLFPPTAARGDVTYWLSAAQETVVQVPADSQVSTPFTETEQPVVFRTVKELDIVPCSLAHILTQSNGARPVERTGDLLAGTGLSCFQTQPTVGDAVIFGLSDAVPNCAVLLRIECNVEGVGVDPRDPPLAWEAWNGHGWSACEVDRDTTGGFNKAGDVVLHVPETHAPSVVDNRRAGWIRCRLVAPAEGQPFYQQPPRLTSATASTIGGTVTAIHAQVVRNEITGMSEGVPGQRFPLAHSPVVASEQPFNVDVSGVDGWQEWTEVTSFARSGPADKHFTVDRTSGQLHFGPAVREPDGSFRHYGAVPAKGTAIRVQEYRTGGGRAGNVARGMLRVQRDPVPFVSTVTNRRPATGGVDGESVEDASIRGPLLLRTRERAVTVDDYEQLAAEAAPDLARVRCVPVAEDPGAVRLLVVPSVSDPGDLQLNQLDPAEDTLARIASFLDERRCLGSRISVEPPYYQGVTVVAQMRAKRRSSPEALQTRAIRALYKYLNPIVGGADGRGWPFGRPVQSGEIFSVLQQLPGVELVEDVRLFGADPATGKRGSAVQRLDLTPHALVFSYGHQVRVTEE